MRGGLGARSPCRGPRRVDDLLLSGHPHLPDSAILRRRLQAPRATFSDRGERRAFVSDLPPADFLPRTWNSGPARDRPSICSWCVLPRATTATFVNSSKSVLSPVDILLNTKCRTLSSPAPSSRAGVLGDEYTEIHPSSGLIRYVFAILNALPVMLTTIRFFLCLCTPRTTLTLTTRSKRRSNRISSGERVNEVRAHLLAAFPVLTSIRRHCCRAPLIKASRCSEGLLLARSTFPPLAVYPWRYQD